MFNGLNRKMSTYYDILGVTRTATKQEIKKQFAKLSFKHHPDASGDSRKYQKIVEAYKVLSDENSRAEYDRKHNTAQRERTSSFDGFKWRTINIDYTRTFNSKEYEEYIKRWDISGQRIRHAEEMLEKEEMKKDDRFKSWVRLLAAAAGIFLIFFYDS